MNKRITRMDDYEGTMVKPHQFPGHNLMVVDGYPSAVSDGFAVDLDANVIKGTSGTILKLPVDNFLKAMTNGSPLTEPKYIVHDKTCADYFILFNQDKKPIAIQTKYYNYFVRKYEGCEFITTGRSIFGALVRGQDSPVGVRYGDTTVGFIMPITISDEYEYYDD